MRTKKTFSILILIAFLLIVIPGNIHAYGGSWAEQVQSRIDLLGILTNADILQPFMLANIFSLGLSSPVRSSLVMVEPYISFLVSGAFYYDNANDSFIGSGGGGLAIGARIRLWGYFSVKPEVSGMYLAGENYKYAVVELGSEFGIVLPSTGPWSLTLDFLRIGVKPTNLSIPNFSLILSPSIGAIYKW